MTRDDLKRLEDLSSENKRLRGDLICIRNASVVSASSCAGGAGKCSLGDPVANMVCAATDVEDQILHNVLEMVEIIDQIPAEKTRKIARRKYIDQRTWSQIADEMGYIDADSARRRWGRFVKAVKFAG